MILSCCAGCTARRWTFLSTHRRCGGSLDEAGADRYITEMRESARLVGLDMQPSVPASVSELAAYFDDVRPQLRVTSQARDAVRWGAAQRCRSGSRWPRRPVSAGRGSSPRRRPCCRAGPGGCTGYPACRRPMSPRASPGGGARRPLSPYPNMFGRVRLARPPSSGLQAASPNQPPAPPSGWSRSTVRSSAPKNASTARPQ